jgi:hypothetical protein
MNIERMKTDKKAIATLKELIEDYEADWLKNTKECEYAGLGLYCAHLGRDYDPICDHIDCPLLRE